MAFEHSLIGLHASAVVVDGMAVAFAGPASRGKSTLAASFAVDGHAVVTDDCLMMEWQRPDPRAVPSYPSLRLWKSTADRLFGSDAPAWRPVAEYTSKLRVGARVRAVTFRRLPVLRAEDLRDRTARRRRTHRRRCPAVRRTSSC